MIQNPINYTPQRVRGPLDFPITKSWETFKEKFPAEAKAIGGQVNYNKILFTSTQLIADEIINSPYGFKMPERMGWLYIIKYMPKVRKTNDQLSRDYDKKIVHINAHTAGYSYKFFWAKRLRGVENIDLYTFRACRNIKRRLAKILKANEKDYYEKISV